MAYWLMKSEPDTFSINDLQREGVAGWDGVRNYQARKNMRAMRTGDRAFFYHSSAKPSAIVGVMEVVREAYPDPTAEKPGWDAVAVKFVKKFAQPLTLEAIRLLPALQSMVLVKNSRLSVQPITEQEWTKINNLLAN